MLFRSDEMISLLVSNPETFGENPEGLVMYGVKRNDENVAVEVHPLFKIKRPEYLSCLGTARPTDEDDLLNVTRAILSKTYDDWHHSSPTVQAFRDRFREEFDTFIESIGDSIPEKFIETLTLPEYKGKENRGNFARYIMKNFQTKSMIPILFELFDSNTDFSDMTENDLVFACLKSNDFKSLNKNMHENGSRWFMKK